MADFDVITSQTVDAFITAFPTYNNTQFTQDNLFVSEAAVLSQTNSESIGVLYAVDIDLGENSTGTAIIKDGNLSFTKTGFILSLTGGLAPPPDVVTPSAATLTTITANQDTAVAFGRTLIIINWDPLLTNNPIPQNLGVATGGLQVIDLTFDPIELGSDEVIEVTGFGAASTLTSAVFNKDQDIVSVDSAAGFSPGDYLEIDDGSLTRQYEIEAVNGNDITLTTACSLSAGFVLGSTVKQLTVLVKTLGVDYAIDYTIGVITLTAGQFTNGNTVSIFYVPLLQDLDHYELYRVNGNETVTPDAGYSEVNRAAVLSSPSVVTVDPAIISTNLSYADTLSPTENGETRTYYLFSVDSSIYPNYSNASIIMVETIPSIPQNPIITVGDQKVFIEWDALSPSTDENTDGYSIYRCDGDTFVPSTSIKVNTGLIHPATPYFDDSVDNVLNRRPDVEVPFPANGQIYTYRVESEDTITSWVVGTKNADIETGAAQVTANKTP